MNNWTNLEEKQAREEYLSMIDALLSSEEFKNVWTGHWDDFYKETFGKKTKLTKGDKYKFMKTWLDNQKIINDSDWNKIEKDDDYYEHF